MPKILVADDNTNIQKMVSLAFSDLGIDVVSVGNGEAAVRRIPDLNPDLVLADIFMPVRNGYEVCEFVKKDTRFSHIPVILLVGAFDPLDEKEARRVGADGVLKKPFVPPDPLIAMVTSALEKNPKLAAEMAKAREVIPEPEPLPAVLEMPAKAEVKPLPTFPEPTPEEAALVYGFGSGKRGVEEDSTEDKSPKPPIAAEVDQEEEEMEESSPSPNWRRNAMDFEVPDESKNMAFALADDTAAAMFPSEKEVPPKHVRRTESEGTKQTDSKITATTQMMPAVSTAPLASVAPPPPPAAAPIAAAPAEEQASALTATFWGPGSSSPVIAEPPRAEAPEIEAPKSKEPKVEQLRPPLVQRLGAAPVPDHALVAPKAQESQAEVEGSAEPPSIEIEPVQQPGFASRAMHWMDAMASALKKSGSDDESSDDSEGSANRDLDTQKAIAPIAVAEPAPLLVEAPEVKASTPTPLANEEETPSAGGAPLPPAPRIEDKAAVDPFFADELDHAASSLSLAPTSEPPSDTGMSTEAPTFSGVSQVVVEPSMPSPEIAQGADPDWLAESEGGDPMGVDPELVVPPAVRVTPEPLLVDETPIGPSGYGNREESTVTPFEFLESTPNGQSAGSEAQTSAVTAETNEPNERIPTGPPPNRDVLAEIPFLSPPPEILEAATKENQVAPETSDVDEMVRKVLEKLQPQLYDLLSQGVLKPLVENVLQNELAKKGK